MDGLEIVARIRAVERFITQREIRHDIVFDSGFQQRPLEPGRIAWMAARHCTVGIQAQPEQDIAAKAFHQRQALAGLSRPVDLCVYRSRWQSIEDLFDQGQTLLDFADAQPHTSVDIALGQ